MPVNHRRIQIRDERIRKPGPPPVTQPVPSERRAGMGAFLFGVIRSVPSADAPYVNVQQVRPADDYEASGDMEFVENTLRAVLCEPNTRGGNYSQWVDDTPEDTWAAASVVHLLFTAHGSLFILHKGRRQYITETGEHDPTDCIIFGD